MIRWMNRLRQSQAARLNSKFSFEQRLEPLEERKLLAADLTGSFVALQDNLSLNSGTTTSVTVDLTNEGDAISKQTIAVDFYAIEADAEFDPQTAVFLSRATTSKALPSALTTNVKLPTSLQAGNYRLVAVIDAANKVAEDNEENNVILSDEFEVTQPDYDLAIDLNGEVKIPANIVQNTKVTGNVKVTLSNTSGTTAFENGQKVAVSVFARPIGGNDDGSDDIEITTKPTLVSVSKLGAGKSVSSTINVTLPASLPADEYSIIVKADSTNLLAETSEDNNTVTGPTILITPPFVDLEATVATKTLAAAVLGNAKGSASVSIANQGNVEAKGNVTVTFYASATGELADGVEIGSVTKKIALKAGKGTTIKGNVVMPNVEESEDYTILAVINFTPSNGIEDSNGENNAVAASALTTVAPAFVDLSTTTVTETFADSVLGNTKGSASVNVSNLGNVDAKGSVTVIFYASASGVIDENAVVIGTTTKSVSLKPNKSTTIKGNVVLPNVEESEDLHILAAIEYTPSNGYVDTNDENNLQATESTTTVAPAFVDLGGVSVTETFLPSVLEGTKGSATVSITNFGNVDAKGTVRASFYATSSGAIDENAILIGHAEKKITLKANKSTTLKGNVTMPDVEESQEYFIIAVLEYSNSNGFGDSDFTNNFITSETATVVAPAYVDISATSVTKTLASAVLGNTKGSASVTVINNGNVDAKGDIIVNFYASTTGELDGTAVSIGSVTKKITLKANKSTTIKGDVTMPNVDESQEYFILAVANFEPSNGIVDIDNENNMGVVDQTTTVATAFVDLAIDSYNQTYANTMAGGSSGNISVTLKNNGNVPAKGNVVITYYASTTEELTEDAIQIGQVTKSITLNNGNRVTIAGKAVLPNPEDTTEYILIAKVTFTPTNGFEDSTPSNNVTPMTSINVTPIPKTLAELLGTMTFTQINYNDLGGVLTATGTFTTSTGYNGSFIWSHFSPPPPVPQNSLSHRQGTLTFNFDINNKPPGFLNVPNSIIIEFGSKSQRPNTLQGYSFVFTPSKTGKSTGSTLVAALDGGLIIAGKSYVEVIKPS